MPGPGGDGNGDPDNGAMEDRPPEDGSAERGTSAAHILATSASRPDTDMLDVRGLKCPLPVLKTRKRMMSMRSGALLTVETSDPLAVIDIPHFCSQDGHALLQSETTQSGHRFLIRKG